MINYTCLLQLVNKLEYIQNVTFQTFDKLLNWTAEDNSTQTPIQI